MDDSGGKDCRNMYGARQYKEEEKDLHISRWGGGVTQPLTEMSTRSRKIIFLESRARPVRRADNLTAICGSTV
jgi:hypothetical protein